MINQWNTRGIDFEGVMRDIRLRFLTEGMHDKVDTGHWQGLKDVPHTKTRELLNAQIVVPIDRSIEHWQEFISPNLPWAEGHFQERIAGEPTNPGEWFDKWPWYRGGVEDHKQQGEFSHTYQERFWPRLANFPWEVEDERDGREGIRFRYGDLKDLIALLADEPTTRQAYLPIWFPEDLAATRQGERVPCTLGYHFIVRHDHLHCFYPMRSVDYVRYLRDDIYMAGRLVQHLCEVVPGFFQMNINPGILTFQAVSLHCFEGDVSKLEREHQQFESDRINRAFS